MTTVVSSTLARGVTEPRGFRAAGIAAGIKRTGNLDLALVVSDAPAAAAAVFTLNRAQAAPVIVSRQHLEASGSRARAIVVNSGCANACTGTDGLRDAREMCALVARVIDCPEEQVLVASTGVIGVALPMDKIREGVPAAFKALDIDRRESGGRAAHAIMTTDPFPKEAAAKVIVADRQVTIGGMAKGSGMIEPMMATMLAFLTTDAVVAPALLDRAVRTAVDATFNAITVDGECSTNDCVMLLANGASGAEVDESSYSLFVDALTDVCRELALGIVRGGEGATKLVTITVSGAATAAEAHRCAKTIANSPLVKTAIHGGDPNWGRLIAAAGRAGVAFELDRAAVMMGPVVLFEEGRPYDANAPRAAEYLQQSDVTVRVHLGAGTFSSTVWTCDLSAEYVRINADYRT